MGEQAGPVQLVEDAVKAEAAGFDFAVISDHFFPWLEAQGHSPYAWAVLGAVAQATDALPLMTYVTCPSFRYHPAVVAQKAATIQLLSGGRFTLGLGSGENLNEHVVGLGWPSVGVRHERFSEAIKIIQGLFTGETFDFRGTHFQVDRARLWDLPETPPPIGVAVSGRASAEIAGRYADLMIAVEPKPELGRFFDEFGGRGKRRVGQQAISFDLDERVAAERAHSQFRWFDSGWSVMSELPGPRAFSAASERVTVEDVAEKIPCGANIDRHVQAMRPFVEAGFTDIALVQIGNSAQESFFPWAKSELLPALREL
jgi:G6PDH family F420-dependent oxidoreductase